VRDNPNVKQTGRVSHRVGPSRLPDDIGGAIAQLLAPQSGWINAQRIEISGGMNL